MDKDEKIITKPEQSSSSGSQKDDEEDFSNLKERLLSFAFDEPDEMERKFSFSQKDQIFEKQPEQEKIQPGEESNDLDQDMQDALT